MECDGKSADHERCDRHTNGSETSLMLTGYQHTCQLTYNTTTIEIYTADFIYGYTAHIIFLYTKKTIKAQHKMIPVRTYSTIIQHIN